MQAPTSIGAFQGASGRYGVWPGLTTAYIVGMLKIVELRQRAIDVLDQDFDRRELHRVVIGNGARQVTMLEQVIDNYIAQRLAGARPTPPAIRIESTGH